MLFYWRTVRYSADNDGNGHIYFPSFYEGMPNTVIEAQATDYRNIGH